MQLCLQENIPYFDTYYRLDGNYQDNLDGIKFPFILKEYAGINNFVTVNDRINVKKNVYKIENLDDLKRTENQINSLNPNLSMKNFFIQEFSPVAEDIRTFVSKGKYIGGWTRKAKDSFMTVSKGEYKAYENPTEKVITLAEKTAKVLKADFIAVDFMYKSDGKPYLQEISLHPGFKAFEIKTGGQKNINIAKIIIESF